MNTSSLPGTLARLRQTFDSGKTRPIEWRLAQLAEVERMMREHESDLAEALRLDLGKCRFESVMTEIGFVEAEAKYARRNLRKWMRAKRVRTPIMAQPGHSYLWPEPKGVVLIIAPWNYPVPLLLAPLVGAIAAGNAGAEALGGDARTSRRCSRHLLPQYLDRDAVAVVEGGVAETTALLDERFDHIFYTGNGRVGRIVMEAAAEHLTPVTLELGGKSPCIVDDERRSRRRGAAHRLGQVHQRRPDLCRARLRPRARAVASSSPTRWRRRSGVLRRRPAESPDYGRIANEQHTARSRSCSRGEVLTGGRVDEAPRYIEPTIVLDPAPDAPLMRDEIFGPILPVITVDEVDDAIEFVTAPKPLALYVFTADAGGRGRGGRAYQLGRRLRQRRSASSTPSCRSAGSDERNGRVHGRDTFETFSHRKPVMKRSFRFDAPMRYPPYTEQKARLLKLVR